MSNFAIVAIIGMMALAGASSLAVEFTIGFEKSMQALISVVLLGASLFVILSKTYADKDRNWAYGTLGALVGFWLHTV
jgi:hypothetical protein